MSPRAALAFLPLLVLVAGCTTPLQPPPEGNFTAPIVRPAPAPYTGAYPLLYPRIRFGEMPITLYFDVASGEGVPFFSGDTVDAARAALLQWEQGTGGIVRFREVADASQAKVVVHWAKELEGDHTLGLGGPTVVDTGRYNVTVNGEVTMASMDTFCLNTVVALHELGHVLGFDHPDDPASFLYKTADCDQGFTPQVTEALRELYQDPAKAELELAGANVSASGRFLLANLTVLNSGLVESAETGVELGAEKRIALVELPALEPGTVYRIQLTAGTPASLEGLQVRLDVNSTVDELDEANNVVPLQAS